MRFWRNTRVAALTGSQTTTVGSSIIGYEWDEDLDNGFRPAGAFRVSETSGTGEILQDYGSTYGPGSATHSMTMYRHSSGALVFGAGTIQWSWGLDSNHDRGNAPADPAAQQATVNLFADMGVQPATIQAGLIAATQVDRHNRTDIDDHLARRDCAVCRSALSPQSAAQQPTAAAAESAVSRCRSMAAPRGVEPIGRESGRTRSPRR